MTAGVGVQFCPDVQPGNARAKECLEENREKPDFSPQCKVEIEKMMADRAADFRLDAKLRKMCSEDIADMCGYERDSLDTVAGYDARVIQCLQDYRCHSLCFVGSVLFASPQPGTQLQRYNLKLHVTPQPHSRVLTSSSDVLSHAEADAAATVFAGTRYATPAARRASRRSWSTPPRTSALTCPLQTPATRTARTSVRGCPPALLGSSAACRTGVPVVTASIYTTSPAKQLAALFV